MKGKPGEGTGTFGIWSKKGPAQDFRLERGQTRKRTRRETRCRARDTGDGQWAKASPGSYTHKSR